VTDRTFFIWIPWVLSQQVQDSATDYSHGRV